MSLLDSTLFNYSIGSESILQIFNAVWKVAAQTNLETVALRQVFCFFQLLTGGEGSNSAYKPLSLKRMDLATLTSMGQQSLKFSPIDIDTEEVEEKSVPVVFPEHVPYRLVDLNP